MIRTINKGSLRHEVYKEDTEEKSEQIKKKPTRRMKIMSREEKIDMERDKKKEREDRAEHKKAWRMQIRWDKDRRKLKPRKIEKGTFPMDHICYTRWNKRKQTKEYAVAWTNVKHITVEPAKNLRIAAIKEYEKGGEYTEEDYLTYLKIRDKLKREQRDRRGEETIQEGDSSEVNTSDIENEGETEEDSEEDEEDEENNEENEGDNEGDNEEDEGDNEENEGDNEEDEEDNEENEGDNEGDNEEDEEENEEDNEENEEDQEGDEENEGDNEEEDEEESEQESTPAKKPRYKK
jgi:hypothetical protein